MTETADTLIGRLRDEKYQRTLDNEQQHWLAVEAADELSACRAELAAVNDGLDFEPDASHSVPDMANVGFSLMEAIAKSMPDYSWNQSPAEVVNDLLNRAEESERLLAEAAKDAERWRVGFVCLLGQALSSGFFRGSPILPKALEFAENAKLPDISFGDAIRAALASKDSTK